MILASITEAGRAVVERATDGLNAEVFEQPGLDTGDVVGADRRCSARSASNAGDTVADKTRR